MPERQLCRQINSTEDVFLNIPYPSEQKIALHFLRRLPDIRLIYEPGEFCAVDDTGAIHKTVPDFQIEYLKTGKKVFVEITAKQQKKTDPKANQRWVMRRAAPDTNYVVLYRDALTRIQNKYPEVDIFPYKPLRKRKK